MGACGGLCGDRALFGLCGIATVDRSLFEFRAARKGRGLLVVGELAPLCAICVTRTRQWWWARGCSQHDEDMPSGVAIVVNFYAWLGTTLNIGSIQA